MIGIGRQLSVGRNPVCRIAVLIHLKIAENPIHPGDKAVAEGVIIFVNRQPCYCGSQPQRKLNIRLGFRTEEHSLVLRTLIKIEGRAAESSNINHGRSAAAALAALSIDRYGRCRAEHHKGKNQAEKPH